MCRRRSTVTATSRDPKTPEIETPPFHSRLCLQQLPLYNAGQRKLEMSTLEKVDPTVSKPALQKDFAWFLCRLPSSISSLLGAMGSQQVPSWSGFNAAISTSSRPSLSKIGYLPVISSSPTELATVNKVLENAVDVAAKTQQGDIVVTSTRPSMLKRKKYYGRHKLIHL